MIPKRTITPVDQVTDQQTRNGSDKSGSPNFYSDKNEEVRPIIASATAVNGKKLEYKKQGFQLAAVHIVLIVLGILLLIAAIVALACIPLYLRKTAQTIATKAPTTTTSKHTFRFCFVLLWTDVLPKKT